MTYLTYFDLLWHILTNFDLFWPIWPIWIYFDLIWPFLPFFDIFDLFDYLLPIWPILTLNWACLVWQLLPQAEKVLQHCSNAAWKVNYLSGKLRAKGLHLSIVVSILFQIDLYRSSKYKSILKYIIFPPRFDFFHNR